MKSTIFSLFMLCFLTMSAQELMRYEMYSDHFDVIRYTKQYQRSFDSIGIIKQKGEYHALTISLYGIMCYDEYMKTGNEYYLEQFLNQHKYFKDSSKFDLLFEGKGIGLPYKFKFMDLPPPWYSGLTQGIAVSYLLRYAKYADDESAFDMAQKVAYTMLMPVEEGGTLSKTPEGGLWIEEYPNSKKSQQVLNGFINGLVGLKEYLVFFPEDTMAQRIHSEVYKSFKETIHTYDTNKNWTSYNRNNKRISVYYLRIQLTQLDHLYTLYGDDFLRKQMSIWSRMIAGKKDNVLKFYKYPNYDYGINLVPPKDTAKFDLNYEVQYQKGLTANERIRIRSHKRDLMEIDEEGVKGKKRLTIIPDHALYSIRVDLNKPKNKKLKVYHSDGSVATRTFNKNLAFQEFTFNQEFDSLVVVNSSLFGKKIHINKITYYDYRSYQMPMYATRNVQGRHQLSANESYKLTYDGVGINESKVFYRYGKNNSELQNSKWLWYQCYPLTENNFHPPADGIYEFFISIPIHTDKIIIRDVKVEVIE